MDFRQTEIAVCRLASAGAGTSPREWRMCVRVVAGLGV